MIDPQVARLLRRAQQAIGQARFLADIRQSLPAHEREGLKLVQQTLWAITTAEDPYTVQH